jgi:uncharacterized protein YcbX
MGGERLASARMTWRGIPGDRGWAVYDEARSGVTGAKRMPALRECRARYPNEPVPGAASPPAEVAFPDGSFVASDSGEAARRLSEHLGRPVTFRSLGPAGSEAAPRLTSEGESPETFREMMGVLPGEPMPDLSYFASDRLGLLRQGNYFDALPLHLLTRTTLNSLARLAPESLWDERRFRPNLLVEAGDPAGFPELGWIGRRLRVGTAVIEVVTGCPRCVVVTQPVDELPQDHRVMRTLVREAKHTAGIYARVAEEGEVRLGDEVTSLE